MPEIGTYSLSGGRRPARKRASSDPTDTVQPRVLASFRNRSALSLLMNMQLLRWSKAKPETTEQVTRLERHSYLTRDWMPRTITALPAEEEECS
jgi:hypothetical protein